MKKGFLSAAVILLSTAACAQAQDTKLGVTLDVTYLSSYIWRGVDVYADDHSAIQFSTDIDLYGTGFGAIFLSSRTNGSRFENSEELRAGLYYQDSIFDGQIYTTAYRLGWVYYNYPDNPSRAFDQQELFLSLSWPGICPAGLVPRYTIAHGWPAKSNSTNASDFGGWVHVLGLEYNLNLPALIAEAPKQQLHLFAEAIYNDGIGPPGETVDHDWSHAVLGVSTSFDLGSNIMFTPALYHQLSMDDSVNTEDETWFSLSMTYKF